MRGHSVSPRVPVCYVVDEDDNSRHFLSLILHGAGVDTEEFSDTNTLAQAMTERVPSWCSSTSGWNRTRRSKPS
jgi:FixJ family two-component response regulator